MKINYRGVGVNLQQLRYAKALAEHGSFSRAAEACAVAQPTLSNGIAQLESELGHSLFVRTTRAVRLSDAGQKILPDIIDILNAQAALVAHARALAHPEKKLIRIGVSPVVSVKYVDTVLEPFRSMHSEFEIVFRELNIAEMLIMLESGQLDFVFGPIDLPPFKSVAGFERVEFFEEPLMFLASSASLKTYLHSKSVSLEQIAHETFVMVPDSCGLTTTTRALFKKKRLKLTEYSGQAMSYGVLQEWAELGIGSAILPRSKVASGAQPEIPIFEGSRAVSIRYCSLWKGGPNISVEIAELAAFLKDSAPTIISGLVR